jgi:hypothetical protein
MRKRSLFPYSGGIINAGLLLLVILLILAASFIAFPSHQPQEISQYVSTSAIAPVSVRGTVITFPSHQPQKIRRHASTPAITPVNLQGTVYWSADYETGDLSQWSQVHAGGAWGNSSVKVVTSPVRHGKYAAKFTLNAGKRAEVSANQRQTGGYPGEEWYYSWSTLIPSVPNAATGWAEWTLITQWMDLLYQCSPPLQVHIRPGTPPHFILSSRTLDNKNDCKPLGPAQEWDLGPLQYDQWNDFTIHIKWSEDPSVGFVEMWRNRVEVVPLTHIRTLDTGGGVYMEQDVYRPDFSGTNVIYFDDLHRHDRFNLNSSP